MLTTLIVEDNAAYRASLHQLLAGRFPAMDIAEAADGEEALRQALSRRFDLVFMDIHLPRGNGLDLTSTIKTTFDDSVVCVITGYDILEYREAAFRHGADHFMVKGNSTESDILGVVESLLRTRFVTLVIVSDVLPRKQLFLLLSLRWPVMIVAEAGDAATGLGHVQSLKPDLVLIELGLLDGNVPDLVRDIRKESPHSTLIGMADDVLPACRRTATDFGVDHCVPLSPDGHTHLVTLVASMHAARTQH